MTLGEVSVTGGGDASYSGDVSSSPVSLDYWRTKITEFQSTLNAVDQIYQASLVAADVAPDSAERDALLSGVDEYLSRRALFKTAAEGLNLGAAAVNAVGGRMPVLSIPATLGVGPLVFPAVAVAALTTAAILIEWGRQWAQVQTSRIEEARRTIELMPDGPDKTLALSTAAGAASQAAAAAAATDSPLASIASIVKIGGLVILAFLGYKMLKDRL